MRIEYAGSPFEMIFDTDNVKSDLGGGFTQRFPDAVAGLALYATRRGGFGGIREVEAVTLPEFRFRAAGCDVALHARRYSATRRKAARCSPSGRRVPTLSARFGG